MKKLLTILMLCCILMTGCFKQVAKDDASVIRVDNPTGVVISSGAVVLEDFSVVKTSQVVIGSNNRINIHIPNPLTDKRTETTYETDTDSKTVKKTITVVKPNIIAILAFFLGVVVLMVVGRLLRRKK